MVTVKSSTKKGLGFIQSHRRADARTLREVYGRWSSAKERAYEECLGWCRETDGEDFRIISANTYGFSVAWYYTDKETGERVLRVETPTNTYIVK